MVTRYRVMEATARMVQDAQMVKRICAVLSETEAFLLVRLFLVCFVFFIFTYVLFYTDQPYCFYHFLPLFGIDPVKKSLYCFRLFTYLSGSCHNEGAA